MAEFSVSVIGAGNVGWHLAEVFYKTGIQIKEIYSRNLTNAKKSVDRFESVLAVDNLDLEKSLADIFIIAVPDDQIEVVANEIKIPNESWLLHCSGTVPAKVLNKHTRFGVFYPMQTFTRDIQVDFKEVPLVIETIGSEDDIIKSLAGAISEKVYFMNSEQRKTLHLAAVFANNFANHCFSIAHEILAVDNIPFEILKNLIQTTSQKAIYGDPSQFQTGPAIRKDLKTVNKQLDLLEGKKDFQDIYKAMTNSIINRYSK